MDEVKDMWVLFGSSGRWFLGKGDETLRKFTGCLEVISGWSEEPVETNPTTGEVTKRGYVPMLHVFPVPPFSADNLDMQFERGPDFITTLGTLEEMPKAFAAGIASARSISDKLMQGRPKIIRPGT